MKRIACFCTLLSALLVMPRVSFGQAAIGMQYFGSFGGGPVDNINLGNLNNHLDIPILHKAGRGIPFTTDLKYDTTIWYPALVNGVKTWNTSALSGYWGWQNLLTAESGYMTYSTTTQSGNCGGYPYVNATWSSTTYGNFVYSDWTGSHSFSGQTNYIVVNPPSSSGENCPTTGPGSTLSNIPASDKSGFTLNASATSSSVSESIAMPKGYQQAYNAGGSYSKWDANGNQITGAGGVYTDTLGQTALTVTGGTPPTNTMFSYAAPSGGSAAYTVSYKSYTVKTNFGCSGVAEYNQSSINLVDKITLPDQTFYQFQYEQTAGGGANTVTARLYSITLPTGGSITYTYPLVNGGNNNGINCTDGTAPTGTATTPSLTRAVSPGGTWTFFRTNVSGNHWQTTITTPADPINQNCGQNCGDQTVIDFQQDGNTTTGNFYETQRLVYQGSAAGTPLSTTITCYNSTLSNCPTTAVYSYINRITTFFYLPNSSGQVSETDTSYGYISVPGYQTEVDSYDYGPGSPPSSPLRKVITAYNAFGSDVRPTSVQIQDGSGNVKSSTTYSYDGTTPTSTNGTPQHSGSVNGGRGNLTTVKQQITGGSSPTYLYRVFTYYDTGMLKTATDWGTTSTGGPNLTTYNYSTQSCGNSFVTSLSEPLSLTRSFTWDCIGGVQTSTTDENGQTSTVYYSQTSGYGTPDPDYWRPYATTDALNYATTLSYPNNTVGESALLFNSGNSVVGQRIKVDDFGRVILNQTKEGPASGNYDSTETDYDVFGRVSKSYLPFTNTADSPCSGTCPGVTSTYDALNRPWTVTDGGGGTTTYTYTYNDVYQAAGPAPSGENTKRKQLQYDGLGRLSSVCEITSATGSGSCAQSNPQTGFWTEYTYDTLGDMTGVTQNAQAASGNQQTRTYTFDMVGRTLTETNPETGSITYVYDSWGSVCGSYTSAGDLVEKIDAMNNVTCMKYDALHRVVQTTYPSGTYAAATPTKCYVYDSATVNGQTMLMAKTRLAEAYTTSAASCPGTMTVDEGFSYSARGEMQDVWEKTPDSGGYYHVDATYWANGRLNVLNGGTSPLPGLPAITYGAMDGKGRITQVTAATGQNPVNSISWNAGNQVTGVTFGSLDNDAYQYDPNTGRMQQYKFNMGTGPQSQTGALTWNANSTLQKMQITDQINTANSQTCNYSHDDLTRIASANCGSVWAQTFSLDPFGNLSKSGSATFTPTYTGASGTGTTPSNQYYQISGGGTGTSNYYDTNGNLKNDVTHSYTWDADGNMLSTDGSTVTMIYDALDRMIEQTRSSGHTEIVYGPYGLKLALMNGQTLVNAFVKLPGGSRAVYGASGLAYYRHADHLGSSRLATTPTRTKYYDVAYAPYGEDYNGSGTTPDLAFTDENQDTVKGGWSTNLYDFMLREYRTAHGRWTSPDPAGLGAVDPTNPQTWNRYAYVLNNPMSMIDLLGDDGCYDADGNQIFATIEATCGAYGGEWLGGGAYVQDGQVYLGSELVGYSQGTDSEGMYTIGLTYLNNVPVGSFTTLFGYLFPNSIPNQIANNYDAYLKCCNNVTTKSQMPETPTGNPFEPPSGPNGDMGVTPNEGTVSLPQWDIPDPCGCLKKNPMAALDPRYVQDPGNCF